MRKIARWMVPSAGANVGTAVMHQQWRGGAERGVETNTYSMGLFLLGW